jgi:hypothetical protein
LQKTKIHPKVQLHGRGEEKLRYMFIVEYRATVEGINQSYSHLNAKRSRKQKKGIANTEKEEKAPVTKTGYLDHLSLTKLT